MSNIKTLHPRCLTGFWILAFFITLKYFPTEESQISGKQLTLTHWLWLRKVTFCVNINKFEYLTDVNQPKHLILNVFVLTYFYKKSFNPANFPMKKEECRTPLSHYSHFIFLSLSFRCHETDDQRVWKFRNKHLPSRSKDRKDFLILASNTS